MAILMEHQVLFIPFVGICVGLASGVNLFLTSLKQFWIKVNWNNRKGWYLGALSPPHLMKSTISRCMAVNINTSISYTYNMSSHTSSTKSSLKKHIEQYKLQYLSFCSIVFLWNLGLLSPICHHSCICI